MALSLERLEALTGRRLQRIGLSATQRPLEEVARFLGGAESPVTKAPKSADAKQQDSERSDEIVSALMSDAIGDDLQREARAGSAQYRPVTVVNAGARKRLVLQVEVPVEDMARLGEIQEQPSGPASQGPKRTSIWQSIYPRLLEIIRGRTSTLIFVNARRVAERLAGALNELARRADRACSSRLARSGTADGD